MKLLSKLEIGHNIDIRLRTDQLITPRAKHDLNILFISDTHITRWSQPSIDQMLGYVQECNPDLVLLGGDYGESLAGLKLFKNFVRNLVQGREVAAIAGNHDYFFGIKRVSDIIESAGGIWINRKSYELEIAGQKIRLDGNKTFQTNSDPDVLRILTTHKPVHPDHIQGNYDLAFAGHLHGGQLVLKQKNNALYPGKWLFELNYSKFDLQNNHALYLVSLGAGDSVPIRYNCPREILNVNVQPTGIRGNGVGSDNKLHLSHPPAKDLSFLNQTA